MEELGWLLRQERARRLWPQQKVADACGLSRQQLSRYETGAATPSWPVFQRILAAYELQPRIELEPLDGDVVAAVERQRNRPAKLWLADVERVDTLPADTTDLRRICEAGQGRLRWPDLDAWLALRVVESLGNGADPPTRRPEHGRARKTG